MYLSLGIRPDGRREILGFWLFGAEGESARGWRQAVREIFPSSKWQLCVR
ncbi:transposase [Candidatus Bipolaricaulota bacterium]|nr:transposase [Candidatus Bipolaricaulota bacterium]